MICSRHSVLASHAPSRIRSQSLCRALVVGLTAMRFAMILLASPVIVLAGDWPTIGGSSERHGQSPETGPGQADLLWQGTQSRALRRLIFTSGDRLVTWRFQSIQRCARSSATGSATGQSGGAVDSRGRTAAP